MAYLGLARKWRPQTFDDLVGQAHISRTIVNAIKSGRIGQGYLFTGTRGIGKTTSARIFAKALRCQVTKDPGVPCNSCEDCHMISEGRSVDVLEIDGASNNSVDNIREIRENAKYLPSTGKYKIYIIDEVHMLSTSAFNALLKTLEEPPAHVIFIFATTDPQKIPATVLSRTQRYDFKRVALKDVSARLKQICDAEKVTISVDALSTLAREAEGSMRDAVSLLDQILAVGSDKITGDTVTEALGLVDKKTILDCVAAILKRQPLDAVEAVGKVHLHGFDLKQFGREILRLLRQIMVTRLLEQNRQTDIGTYLDLSDVDLADMKQLAPLRSIEDLDMLFRLLNHGLEDVARSSIPKMVMDVLVIKMATSEDLMSLADLSGPGDLGPLSSGSAKNTQSTASNAPVTPPSRSAAPVTARSRTAELLAAIESGSAAQATPPAKTAAAAAKASEPATGAPISLGAAPREIHDASNWVAIVQAIKAQRPMVGSILEHLSFEGLTEAGGALVLTLGYTRDHSFYRDQLQSRAYSDLMIQLLKNHLGRAVRLDYKEVLSGRSIEGIETERKRNLLEERRKTVLESEAIKATQQLLGARLERLDVAVNEERKGT